MQPKHCLWYWQICRSEVLSPEVLTARGVAGDQRARPESEQKVGHAPTSPRAAPKLALCHTLSISPSQPLSWCMITLLTSLFPCFLSSFLSTNARSLRTSTLAIWAQPPPTPCIQKNAWYRIGTQAIPVDSGRSEIETERSDKFS